MVTKKSRFGEVLTEALRQRNMKQASLADSIGVSAAYVSSITSGRRMVSPARIDDIAQKCSFTDNEVSKLHRAAALDAGFKLDLPDDF